MDISSVEWKEMITKHKTSLLTHDFNYAWTHFIFWRDLTQVSELIQTNFSVQKHW